MQNLRSLSAKSNRQHDLVTYFEAFKLLPAWAGKEAAN
jgi:hypothetical protein